MSKLFGDNRVINEAQNATPGDRSVYINFEALNNLPDQYEPFISEVKFDPLRLADNFSDVGGGTWMPSTQLMYKIGEACGISGGQNSITEPIVEEIDINPMLMKPIDAAPTYRKMNVGRRVSKFSERMQEDGTFIKSSVCTSEYNVWERCVEAWSKEEMYTNGYTKAGKYDNKYDNQYKRKAHFDGEMKFAHAKAETKAHCKTIRELAGLVTGYKQADLQKGRLIFAKIRRSREILKAESAARLSAMSRGLTDNRQSVPLLFGSNEQSEPETMTNVTPEPEVVFNAPPQVEHEQNPLPPKQEEMLAVLRQYESDNLFTPSFKDPAEKIMKWLKDNIDKNINAELDKSTWERASGILSRIEATIPEQGRVTHREMI